MDALKDLEAWRRGCRFSVSVFHLLTDCTEFAFRDQLVRSSLSIPSNLAEGYERGMPGERVQFLRVAKGSCGEAWTQLLIGADAGLLPPDGALKLADDAKRIAKMTAGLIAYIGGKSG